MQIAHAAGAGHSRKAAAAASILLLLASAARADPGDPPPRDHMRQTFNEDFASFQPSVSGLPRWKTTYDRQNRTLSNNHEWEFYVDDSLGINPFKLVGGTLEISAAAAAPGATLPYTSGMITTQASFWQRYGYFEMRAQLPRGAGLWPAFWLLPTDGSWPPEIDVMEMLGNNPGKIYLSLHTKPPGGRFDKTLPVPVADTSGGFHTYGVDWQPDMVRWYFDDREVGAMPTPGGLDKPMYLLVNLGVGGPGSWPGPPNAATRFPAHMVVQFVHAYQ